MTERDIAHRGTPWSAPLRLEDVPETGSHIDLHADEATRAALAAFAGLRSVPRAEASFDVTRQGPGGLRVVGEVRATVGQVCVVTLEPMESEIVEAIDVVFKPAEPSHEIAAGAEPAEELPEPLIDGVANLGALATEFLVLGIDPYPRKPGAVFSPPASPSPADGPFAALAQLKRGAGKKN